MLSLTTNINNKIYFKHRNGSQVDMEVRRFNFRTNEVELEFNGDLNCDFNILTKERLLEARSRSYSTERLIFGGIRRIWSDGNVYSSWDLSNERILTVVKLISGRYRIILTHYPSSSKIEVNASSLKIAFKTLRSRIHNVKTIIHGIR